MGPLLRRCAVRAALPAAVCVALLGVPGSAAAAPDVARLRAQLEAVTAEATALASALERESSRDVGLRVALQLLEEEREAAQARLDARVRQVYIGTRPDPVGGWQRGLAAPGLQRVALAGTTAALQVERDLVEAVATESAEVAGLRAAAEARREGLRAKAAAVLAAQDRARALLAEAEAAAAALAASAAADAERARVAAARTQLDAVSATVTTALTPAQTRRSRNAAATEAPVVALVEAAGSGYPAGYVPTGQVLRGVASWYGPGFVGNPTASGAPYDPERLTCAHRSLPLGTVVRVSRGELAISCLVNDRGPYVGDRILDLSRAGSRALGFDGVAPVVVEVLAPG